MTIPAAQKEPKDRSMWPTIIGIVVAMVLCVLAWFVAWIGIPVALVQFVFHLEPWVKWMSGIVGLIRRSLLRSVAPKRIRHVAWPRRNNLESVITNRERDIRAQGKCTSAEIDEMNADLVILPSRARNR